MGAHKHALFPYYEPLLAEFEEVAQRDPTDAESFKLWAKAQEKFDDAAADRADAARKEAIGGSV